MNETTEIFVLGMIVGSTVTLCLIGILNQIKQLIELEIESKIHDELIKRFKK